jgi:hypothetical protein
MERAAALRHTRFRGVSVVTGIAIAVAIVVSIGPPGFPLPRATGCQLGAELGRYTIRTPTTLVNIPDGGNISTAHNEWNLTMTSGSLTTNPLQPFGNEIPSKVGFETRTTAGIAAEYGDFNWTFYRTVNASEIGGVGGPCTQPYIAEIGIPGGACGGFDYVPLANNASDAVPPHVWNGTSTFNGSETYPGCPRATSGTYVWFDSSYHANGTGSLQPARWDLYNSTGSFPLTLSGVARVPIVVTVPYDGGRISARGVLTWYIPPSAFGSTAEYDVPGGWIWMIAPVGPAASAIDPALALPALAAFERLAC